MKNKRTFKWNNLKYLKGMLIGGLVMMVAGALLVIWGMADLYLGREDK